MNIVGAYLLVFFGLHVSVPKCFAEVGRERYARGGGELAPTGSSSSDCALTEKCGLCAGFHEDLLFVGTADRVSFPGVVCLQGFPCWVFTVWSFPPGFLAGNLKFCLRWHQGHGQGDGTGDHINTHASVLGVAIGPRQGIAKGRAAVPKARQTERQGVASSQLS